MAVRLNLYHEIAHRKALEARDPLRLSLIGIGVLALLLAGYYLLELSTYTFSGSTLRGLQADLARMKPRADEAVKMQSETSKDVERSQQLVLRVESRMHWTQVLQLLAATTPEHVQLLRFSGDVMRDKNLEATYTVNLEGMCAGVQPRVTAEDFRSAIQQRFATAFESAEASFRNLEDGKEGVQLKGQDLATASFTINLVLRKPKRGAAPEAQ